MIAPIAVAGIAAGLGAGAGLLSGQPKNLTSTTTTTPYGGKVGNDYNDWLLNQGRQLYNQTPEWQSTYNPADFMGGGGGGGGGAPNYLAQAGLGQAGGGGGAGPMGYSQILNQGQGGGGGGGGGGQPYLNWNATPDQYLQPIVSGQNLDIANNAQVQGMNESLAAQYDTSFQRAQPYLQSQFGSAGRFGGGASAAQNALLSAENTRNLGSAVNQNEMSAWSQLLGQQTAGLGMLSDQTNTGRGLWQSDIANRRTTAAQRAAAEMSSIASMYGSDKSAGASRFGTQMGYASDLAGYAQSGRNARMGLMGTLSGNQLEYDAMQRDAQFDPWRRLGMTADVAMPILQGFGTQTTTGQNPNYQSPLANALQGAAGMGAQGYGYAKMS